MAEHGHDALDPFIAQFIGRHNHVQHTILNHIDKAIDGMNARHNLQDAMLADHETRLLELHACTNTKT